MHGFHIRNNTFREAIQMTIKSHEDKFHQINKDKLGAMLTFGLIGIGLILLSIWSSAEARDYSRDEAHEYCRELHWDDYNNTNSGYRMCIKTYTPMAAGVVNAILLTSGVIMIIIGFVVFCLIRMSKSLRLST